MDFRFLKTMRPLFCITALLSVLWMTSAAPQLMNLNSSTVSELNDLTTTTELTSPEKVQSTSPVPSDNEELSSTEISSSSLESSTVSVKLKEEYDETNKDRLKEETELSSDSFPLQNDTANSTSISTDSVDAFTNVGITSLKPTENSETLNESEIPITRYVPPLDPIKHMLRMGDIKVLSNYPYLVAQVMRKKPATDNSTTEEFETTTYETHYTTEEVTVSPEDNKKLVAETTVFVPTAPTENNNKDAYVTTVESEKKIEPTENFAPDESSESTVDDVLPFDIIDKKENSAETIEKIIANESSEKVISEPLEVEEKGDTTIRDFTTISSTVILKSDELTSVKAFDNDSSNDYSTTLTPTAHTEEIILDSTEKNNKVEEETAAVLKNFNTEINVKETTDEIINNVTVKESEEITSTIFSSTEDTIYEETSTGSDMLLKNNDELTTELPISVSERTTIISVPSESESGIDTSTAKEILELTFTPTTTEIPETSSKEGTESDPKPEPETGRINISLDDELEFRAIKFPQNISKVSYVENETVNPAVFEVSSELTTDSETSTSSIFTTIAEILFSSSTEVPPKIPEMTEAEVTHETTTTDNLPLKEHSESGAILSNDSSDVLTLQSVTPELDSVSAEESTVASSSIESISIELEPEELLKSESGNEFADENTQDERNSETTLKVDTTTLSSLKTESTTEEFLPSTLTLVTTSESENADMELEIIDKPDNKTEDQNDAPTPEKYTDYLSNNKNRYVSGNNTDMVAAVQFLHYHDKASSEQCFKLVNAHWNYATNLTEENKKKQLEQTLQYSLYHKAAWKNATSFAWKTFNDTLLRRWFKSLSILGTSALPEDKLNEFNKLKAEMKNTYSTAKICTYIPPEEVKKGHILQEKDCNLTLEPDLQRILTKSRDYDELVHVWKSWRDAAGKPIKEKYLRFVELGNEAARINGFSDIGDMWREAYESETFESDLEELWEQLRPLYEHLHAYVRRRLIQQYGADKIKEDGPIPAHLFGNMWAQSWVSLLDITQPFPGKPSVDVTPIMQAKNMTPYEMFKISEEFFISLGLKSMPETFWKHSLIEKPKDREIICHASAWDFCNGKDYRIKQCTDITMEDLITVHHEMGHIQYFLQYARQPAVFREGANPGFHEAIGDVLALSVSTPKHLESIGLLDDVADDPEGDLNFLLYTALDKVSFIPTGYLIELWRWGLFSGEIKPEEMNTKWWDLRLKYQGVCPPVKRTDTDFDPGAKFHVPGHVPYIRYFVSFVIQFQFHKVLCDAAGHTGPLYKCDIYRSKEAGQILSQVMELGSSEHWSEAMKIMTGGATNKMDAGPILEYFEPLLDFLKEQNQNETLGWRSNDSTICP